MRYPLAKADEEAINTLDEPFRSRVVQLVANVQHAIEDMEDIHLTVEDGRRSFAQQLIEYKKGRKQDQNGKWVPDPASKQPIVTRAAPGYSAHQYNRAIHLVLRYNQPAKDGLYHWLADKDTRWTAIIGQMAEAIGLSWGGRIAGLFDASHVEDPDWMALGKALGWKGIPDGKRYTNWKKGDGV